MGIVILSNGIGDINEKIDKPAQEKNIQCINEQKGKSGLKFCQYSLFVAWGLPGPFYQFD